MNVITAYVVESPMRSPDGTPAGTARVYVATEARAMEIVSELPQERTYRAISIWDMPEAARKNLLSSLKHKAH